MRIEKALKKTRLTRALIGVDRKEYDLLLPVFKGILEEDLKAKKDRKRAIGGGRKGHLGRAEEKLFYILFYLKVYPTYDVSAFFFDSDRSRACRRTQKFRRNKKVWVCVSKITK